MLGEAGHTERSGHLQAVCPPNDAQSFGLLAQRFGTRHGGGQVHVGHQQQKLFTAVAAHHIGHACRGAQHVGGLAQNLVTGQVAMFVVDAFEMVYVEHHDGQRRVFVPATGQAAFKGRCQVVSVVQAGQRVVGRLSLQPGLQMVDFGEFLLESGIGRLQRGLAGEQFFRRGAQLERAGVHIACKQEHETRQPHHAERRGGPMRFR